MTVSGFASTVSSSACGSAASSRSSAALGERRRAATEEDGLHPPVEPPPLPIELLDDRVRVGAVLVSSTDGRDEVAVPAAPAAERQVDIEVPDGAAHTNTRPAAINTSPAATNTAESLTCILE